MKLLRSTKSNTAKNRNEENVPHLEITELVYVHCNIFNNEYQPFQEKRPVRLNG